MAARATFVSPIGMDRRYLIGFCAAIGIAFILFVVAMVASDNAAVILSAQ
jgi:hypothetical protein